MISSVPIDLCSNLPGSMDIVLGGDICAIPDRVIRSFPRSVVVGTFPLRVGEASLITTSPTIVLHKTSAALSRAAARIATIEAILLATSIDCGRVILGSRPILWRRWVILGNNVLSVMFGLCFRLWFHRLSSHRLGSLAGDIYASPHRVMGMHPMSMMISTLPC